MSDIHITYRLDLNEVTEDLAIFTANTPTHTAVEMPKEDWIKIGRPGCIESKNVPFYG